MVLNQDPRFVDLLGPDETPCTGGEDYRLGADSPAIDSGCNPLVLEDFADLNDNGDTTELTPLDLDDLPRFIDYPAKDDSTLCESLGKNLQ